MTRCYRVEKMKEIDLLYDVAFVVGCSKNICIAICMVNVISSRSSRYSDILAESVRV